MKTRNGFVSNSSSSSFIIWGAKLKKEQVKTALGIATPENPEEGEGEFYYMEDAACDLLKGGVELRDTRYYFGGEETDDVILGKSFGSLSDGSVKEMPEVDKTEIMDMINKNGFHVTEEDIKLYVQMISNDNY